MESGNFLSIEVEYNLPGYRFTSCYLFDTALEFIDLLNKNGIIEKMKNTCQLGTMKYIYPGAHHTRYKYVFTQLSLTSNLATYAIPAMQWAYGSDMIVGKDNADGTGMILDPNGSGTRAQIATMMMRFCENIVK